jgi:hypothetical protein
VCVCVYPILEDALRLCLGEPLTFLLTATTLKSH